MIKQTSTSFFEEDFPYGYTPSGNTDNELNLNKEIYPQKVKNSGLTDTQPTVLNDSFTFEESDLPNFLSQFYLQNINLFYENKVRERQGYPFPNKIISIKGKITSVEKGKSFLKKTNDEEENHDLERERQGYPFPNKIINIKGKITSVEKGKPKSNN